MRCQRERGYKDPTGALVPCELKTVTNIPACVLGKSNRVFVYTNIDSGDRARTLLGFYQFNGDIFTRLYVMNTKEFADAEVAKWLKDAATMAQRLQARP